MADGTTQESAIRMEIEKRKDSFTYLAIGICIMVIALVFLAMFAISGVLVPMAGAFVALIVGLLIYDKGHRGRVQVRALEYQLSAIAGSSAQQGGQASTKYCKHCGGIIAKDSTFCEHCGKRT